MATVSVHVEAAPSLAFPGRVPVPPGLLLTFDPFVLWGEALRNCCVNCELAQDPEDVIGALFLPATGKWEEVLDARLPLSHFQALVGAGPLVVRLQPRGPA